MTALGCPRDEIKLTASLTAGMNGSYVFNGTQARSLLSIAGSSTATISASSRSDDDGANRPYTKMLACNGTPLPLALLRERLADENSSI